MEIVVEPGTRAGSRFYHIQDGYHYHRNRDSDDGGMYFKCVFAARGCDGRAALSLEGFRHTQRHQGHGADLLYPDEMALRRAILDRCRSLECVSFRNIIDEEGLKFPPEVAERVTLPRMRTPMRNARLRNFPNPPANLRQLTDILLNPQYSVLTMTSDGTQNLYLGSVEDANGGHHIVFSTPRQLSRLKRHFRTCHSDGTFKAVPVGRGFAAQVYVICCVWRSTILYIAWALMENCTELAYEAVLQLIRHRTGPTQLQLNIADFEVAPHNAWENNMDVTVQGCLWHFARALIHQAGELNLIPWMRAFEEIRAVIQLSIALALLPENLMVTGYHIVAAFARRQGLLVLRRVRPFLIYLWRQWIGRRWMRRRLCVFRSKQRTNNASESMNRCLRDTVGTHPNVYHFIGGLVKLEHRHHIYWRTLKQGRNPTRARKRTSIMNDNRIQALSNDLENAPGPINVAVYRFLKAAAYLMVNMVDEAIDDGN